MKLRRKLFLLLLGALVLLAGCVGYAVLANPRQTTKLRLGMNSEESLTAIRCEVGAAKRRRLPPFFKLSMAGSGEHQAEVLTQYYLRPGHFFLYRTRTLEFTPVLTNVALQRITSTWQWTWDF